jgi:hypothetical protein
MSAGLNGLLFLGVVGFSIYRSKQRWSTVLFMLMAMGLTLLIGLAISIVFPALNTNAVGATAFDVMLLVGMLTALVHSSRARW